MKYKLEVLSYPDYKRSSQIWYYPVGKGGGKDRSFTMSDGESVQYKFHIALDPSMYKESVEDRIPSRDVVSTFLLKNNIYHKCGGDYGAHYYMNPGTQYGKMFTVYTANLEEFYIVAKGMRELAAKYDLHGIPLESFKTSGSNMQYEIPVPDTNDTLYYTVEKASPGAIINSGSLPEEARSTLEAKASGGLVYLGSSGAGYEHRLPVLNHYMGEGPIDFLY